MTRLCAAGLGWAIGGRFVLVDVDLALAPGSITVLTGENGAGKSSLLELLAGHRRPARGQVRLDGVPLGEIAPAHLAKRIARLDHAPGLYLDLTAHENATLFQRLLHRDGQASAVTSALHDVGLAGVDHHRPVRGFSRGMLQRAALARVLASGADVWLLDEPSTGLDRAGGAQLAGLLRQARDRGVTVLLATHDPALLPLADQQLHVQHGHVRSAEAM